jgi:hypothetical protein
MYTKYLNFLKSYFWLIGVIPITIYYSYLAAYGQNIPHWDDYAIRNFIDSFNAKTSFLAKIQLIFSQHNEHRIAYTRIVALIIYWFCGLINFKYMMWVGNLSLLCILFLIYKVLKYNKLETFYITPICFILFQLSQFENTFWGMASIQNFTIVFFVLISFWQIANDKVPYIWATFAAFTSANGVLFLPLIGIVMFLYLKSYRNLAKFMILSVVLLLIYFTTYQKPPDSQPIDLSNLLLNIKAVFVNFGSFIDLNTKADLAKRVNLTFMAGLGMYVICSFGLYGKYVDNQDINTNKKVNLVFFTAIYLFVLATCAVTTLSRIQYGFYVFLVSRYKIYSIIALCFCYSLCIIYFKTQIRNYLFFSFLILSIYLFFNTLYFSKSEIVNYQKAELASFYNGWHDNDDKIIVDKKSSFNYISSFLDQEPVIDSLLVKPILGKVKVSNGTITINNDSFEVSGNGVNDGAYIELSSQNKSYIFGANQQILNSKKSFLFRNGKIFSKGFTCNIPLAEIESGNYFINILNRNDADFTKIPTNYYIEIDQVKTKKAAQNW